MKKSKVIFLALLACAFGASARTVTSVEAQNAARAWVHRGQTLGARFPSDVATKTAMHTTTNNAVFYTVKMANGGTVFTSGDTTAEPIICFTSDTGDFSTIDKDSPLWALLNADVSNRQGPAKPAFALATMAAAQQQTELGENEQKWAALVEEGEGLSVRPNIFRVMATGKSSVGDRRVDRLVQSAWNQSNVGGQACYNYYTPNGPDPEAFSPGSTGNAVCGCVATAMAQIMRYWEYPKTEVTPVTKTCSWTEYADDGTTVVSYAEMNLTTQGGVYDWENMTLVPAKTEPETNRQCIGKLTSDCGITVNMGYSNAGSGAYTGNVPGALMNAFGYANAEWYGVNGNIDASLYPQLLYANFDAGCPVEMSISHADGSQGHAIVGDGYGYDDGVAYVHLNMGWSGYGDMWYNLPHMQGAYSIFHGVAYNIFPEKTGLILSGRITDDYDKPIDGAVVTVYATGSDTPVASITTTNGIYSFILPEATYSVNAIYGRGVSDLYGIDLTKANSWGNDMLLMEPAARIVRGDVTNVYSCLDKALKGVTNDADKVEILRPITLKESVTVTNSCTIVATNVACAVTNCWNESRIVVGPGVTVTMADVVFDVGEKQKTVAVDADGVLRLDEKCDLKAIETAVSNNLVIASKIAVPLYVDCTNAVAAGQAFAIGDLDYETATNCAHMLMHYRNTRLGGEAYTNESGAVFFRWSPTAPVSREAAIGQLNGVNYRSLDDMLADVIVQDVDAEIVMYRDASFTHYLDKAHRYVVRGEDAPYVIQPSGKAGFRIPTGGSLTISNIVFSGYVDGDTDDDHGFILVDGGELTLDDGAVLDSMVGNVYRGSGVIDLWSGMATMRSGAAIVNCQAEGGNWYDEDGMPDDSGGFGGAIYVCGRDCTLNLQGGSISNCYASTEGGGGGIYACGYGDDAGINLSGNLTIVDNRSGNCVVDDLYMYNEDALAGLKLVGDVNGKIGIRYSSSAKFGNAEGDAFMTNAIGVATAHALFNDTDDTLTAVAGEGGLLVWAKKSVDDGQCDERLASAHVYYPDDTVRHYTNLVTAIAHMTNGTTARIEMRRGNPSLPRHNMVRTTIALPTDCNLTLTAGEAGYRVRRDRSSGILIPAGTSLAVTNLVMDSSNPRSVTNAFLIVDGGALTLTDGACVSNIVGNASSDAAAIFVCNGGTVTMESGSRIYGCQNTNNYDMVFDTGVNYGCGGGILVDGGKAFLHGGEIANCLATRGGGVYACNGSTVRVSGNMRITGNRWQKANGDKPTGNVYVADNSELCLDGPLTGKIGKGAEFYVGGAGDPDLVATIWSGYAWTNDVEALMKSATNFVHDVTSETGVAVTNGMDALIVWSAAAKDGIYAAKDGTKYVAISLGEHTPATLGPLPELSAGGRDQCGVAAALTVSGLADDLVYDAITGNDDPVKEYDTFRAWANDIGVDEVVKSERAYVSYEFGTEKLLEDDPTIEIANIADAGDGQLSVSVVVRDGEDPVAVASARVKEMFEATGNVSDWSIKLDLTVEDVTQSTASEVKFTVKPVGAQNKAFIRLKY